MESLFFMLMFLLYGELPWKPKYLKANDFEDILETKLLSNPSSLWPNLPSKKPIFLNIYFREHPKDC